MKYHAFLSYSHADRDLTRELQRALHTLAKPWHRMRALNTFRDETNLAAEPSLWSRIEGALMASEYFLLISSPESAHSDWVAKEVATWLRRKSAQRIILVLIQGTIQWDNQVEDFDWDRTDAIPRNLARSFSEEPLFIDLRQMRAEGRISADDEGFREAVAPIAAALHEKALEDFMGEDVRQHQRTIRLRNGVIAGLGVLAVAAVGFGVSARISANRAVWNQSSALASLSAVQRSLDPTRAFRLSEAAYRLAPANLAATEALVSAFEFRSFYSFLGRHDGTVLMADFSPDGRLLATASQDATARIWNWREGTVTVLSGHWDNVESARFSPDGRLVLTGSRDGTARVWTLDGVMRAELRGHSRGLTAARFSPDGSRIVTASKDNTARLWDLHGRFLRRFCGPTREEGLDEAEEVFDARFSPDGQHLLTVQSRTVRVFRLDGSEVFSTSIKTGTLWHGSFSPSGDAILVSGAHGQAIVARWRTGQIKLLDNSDGDGLTVIHSSRFSPDGQHIALAHWDNSIRLWNAEGGKLGVFNGHTDDPLSVRFSPDGKLLLSAGADRTARLWDLQGNLVRVLKGHERSLTQAVFSTDGKLVATVGFDNEVRVWELDTPTGMVFHTALPEASPITGEGAVFVSGQDGMTHFVSTLGNEIAAFAGLSPRFNKRKKQVLTVTSDGTAHVWDTSGNGLLEMKAADGVTDSDFSASGDWIITRSGRGEVDLWNSDGGHRIRFETRTPVALARFSPTGNLLLFLYDDSKSCWVELRDLQGRVLWTASGLSSLARLESRAKFSADGKWISLLLADPMVEIRNLAGETIAQLRGHKGPLTDVCVLPGSKGTFTAAQDGTVRIWSPAGAELKSLREIKGVTWEIDCSPDGEFVLTTGDEFAVQLWHRTGRLIRAFEVGRAPFAHARFSASGKNVFVVTGFGSVWSWPVDPEEILRLVNESGTFGHIMQLDATERARFGLPN